MAELPSCEENEPFLAHSQDGALPPKIFPEQLAQVHLLVALYNHAILHPMSN